MIGHRHRVEGWNRLGDIPGERVEVVEVSCQYLLGCDIQVEVCPFYVEVILVVFHQRILILDFYLLWIIS